MADLWHEWGGDLTVAANGDISVADGSDLGNQRILRRLLTNLGDYIWQLDYGAGLGGLVGQPANETRLRAMIRAQIFKEASVASSPEPVVELQPATAPGTGFFYVTISYTQASTGDTQVLSFSLGSQS